MLQTNLRGFELGPIQEMSPHVEQELSLASTMESVSGRVILVETDHVQSVGDLQGGPDLYRVPFEMNAHHLCIDEVHHPWSDIRSLYVFPRLSVRPMTKEQTLTVHFHEGESVRLMASTGAIQWIKQCIEAYTTLRRERGEVPKALEALRRTGGSGDHTE